MKYLIGLFLALSACSKNEFSSTANFPNQYKIYEADSSCSTVKRIYLTHGFGGNKSTYDSDPFVNWINALKLSCYQIISYDLPYGDFTSHFIGGGLTYKNNFIAYLGQLKREIEAKKGMVKFNIHGGVSFGGFHAIMANELTNHFDGFFALKPVTDYVALDELKSMSSEHFNAFNDVETLSNKKGLIIWGNQDLRIDYTLTIKLLNQLNSFSNNQVQAIELNEGHASNDSNLQMIVDYLNNNF